MSGGGAAGADSHPARADARPVATRVAEAALFGDLPALHALLARGADPNASAWCLREGLGDASPAHFAALSGQPAALDLLARRGATLTLCAANGLSPLGWLATAPDSLLMSYARSHGIALPPPDHEETLRTFVAWGASLEAEDDFGCTPMKYAATRGDVRMLAMLWRWGAQAAPGPLIGAMRSGRLAAARALIELGADLRALDAVVYDVPLYVALARRELLALALAHGGVECSEHMEALRREARRRGPPEDVLSLLAEWAQAQKIP